MKRGADNQISKDDNLDYEDDDSEPGQGFRKADETVLAGRKIRALPKRSSTASLGSAPPLSDPAAVPEVPKFGGFSGFGSTTFGSASTPAVPTSSLFGTPAPSPSKPPPASVSSSASGATKAFASFLSNSSSATAVAAPLLPQPASSPGEQKDEVDPAALKYYTSLRGLNVSFISAISKTVEQNPFADISDMITHYKNFRVSVQNEFDEKEKAKAKVGSDFEMKVAPAAPPPTTAFGSSGSSDFVPIAVPASLASFGPAPSSSGSGGGGGFTPSLGTSASTGFTWPPASSTANPAKSPFGSGSSSFPDFFGASKTTTTSTTDAKPTSGFSSSPFGSPSSTSLFGAKPPAEGSSLFGGTTFSSGLGSGSSKADESAKAKDVNPFAPTTSPPRELPNPFSTSFSAGKVDTKSATTSLFGASSSSMPPTTNASPPSTKTPAFGEFGAMKTTTFNPVGFGFGSGSGSGSSPPTSKTADTDPKTEAVPNTTASTSLFGSKPGGGFGGASFGGFGFGSGSGSGSSGFSFAKPAETISEASGSSAIATTDTGADADADAGTGDDSKLLPTKKHDEEGEGEEDEETTHTAKSKVYRLVKNDDGASEWRDMGIGMLRLKKHKETEARRVLLRNSSTGKITVNFNIYSGLSPSVTGKNIGFVGHDEAGSPTTYRLRTQSDQHAKDLKDALNREIEFVKGKGD